MSERKYRIAGPDSKLAHEHPEVTKFLSLSERSISKICYGAIALYIRCIGFVPQTKEDAIEVSSILDTINEHNLRPWIITSPNVLLHYDTVTDSKTSSLAEYPSIEWDDPAMEQDLL